MSLRVAVPDLISPSYFPLIAAVELGLFAEEGLDATVELCFPVDEAMRRLRLGELALVGGAAHAVPFAFPRWQGGSALAALSHGTYWFLVVRSDLGIQRADLEALIGRRIGAAPVVELSLQRIIAEAGIAPGQIDLTPVPHDFLDGDMNFGVAAARALEKGMIDGFWANGMGAAVAVRSGVGTVVLDARRGDGPAATSRLTFPALVAANELIDSDGGVTARAAVRALVRAQHALRAEPALARGVGDRLFPAREAALIVGLVERDSPYYEATITDEMVADLSEFQLGLGLIDEPVGWSDVVATDVAAATWLMGKERQ